ncbi:MAG: DNA primase [Lachnospiraceae bacterium]|nr:DNA primase [Lachnospiraceae bacterium]
MYYPEDIVEEVRSRNNIVDVVSEHVRLQKKGSTYFGLCPFHNEKTPSFSVSPNKQMFYCFGCGAGGNVYSFLMQYENATFQEAIKTLADRAGIKLPEIELTDEMKKAASEKQVLLEINKEAAKYFYYALRSPAGKNGYDYFKNGKLSDETMKAWGLGYSNMYADDLVKYLRTKGYSDEMIVKSGLASHDEKRGTHDKFWNRVMFPIQDANHRVIGFGGRVMGEGEPKYLNSPETPVFDKSRNLYGLNYARSSKKNHIILCEGYMDVIAMHQAGFTEAVASLGTAFTSGQANILKRFTENVILSYDSDGAGTKAALRAIKILRECGMSGKVLDLKPYKDPDEFIKNLGAEEFEQRIKNARNGFYFEVDAEAKEYDLNDPEEKTRFHREIARMLCAFPDDVERNNYLEGICREYSINAESMRKLVGTVVNQTGLLAPLKPKPKSGEAKKSTPEEGIKKAQRILITWLTEEPWIYKEIKEYISAGDFTDELYGRVAKRVIEGIEADKLVPAALISEFDDEQEQREVASMFNTRISGLDGMPLENESAAEKARALKDIVLKVKENSYDYYSKNLASDVAALDEVIKGKKLLEKLRGITFTYTE